MSPEGAHRDPRDEETEVMFTLTCFRRFIDRTVARRPRAHRPLVEGFEGRQVLSTLALIQGQHIGMAVVAPDTLNFTKINVPAWIQGNHIGTSVTDIVGNHIGTGVTDIVGNHIGTSASATERHST
jgi:hypothetical protein